jgi:hypothetical protein
MRILVALPMVVPPSFLTCSSSLFNVLKSTISNINWWHLVCIIIVGSELSLVEFGGSTPPHFAWSVFYS